MEPKRVLIVDDQHLFAEGLKYIIEGESDGKLNVVGIAENGQKAVDMVKRLEPDVILMDVRMPVMDGVAATRAIKLQWAKTFIMILTTFDDDEIVFEALNAGADGYVLKSIEPSDLILAIDALQGNGVFVSRSVGFRFFDGARTGPSDIDIKAITTDILAKAPELTVREAEIVGHILRARSNGEIAEGLFISEKTVRNHVSAVYEKLGVHSRPQLISLMNRLGLIGKQ